MIGLLIYVLILGLIYWAISALLSPPEPLATIIKIIFLVLVLIALLQMVGWVSFYPVRRPLY